MISGSLCQMLRKFDTNISQICPPHLRDVATLPWEFPKSHFQQYYSHILYFWLFTLSQKKTNCNPLAHHTWNVTTQACEMQKLFHLTEGLLRSFKCRWLWKEPVVMCGNWNVSQAMSQQLFKATTFCMDACFRSFSPLINCTIHHVLLKFSPCAPSRCPNSQLVRFAVWYSIHAPLL